MTTVLVALAVTGFIVWLLVGVVAAIAIGMSIAEADRREMKPCCPHPTSEAPETVRGEFRAVVVVPSDDRRGTRVDVRL